MATWNDTDIEAFVRAGRWFASLPEALQRTILDQSEPRSYYRRELLSRENSQGRGLFCIFEGQVAATRWVSGGEEEALLHVSGPGMWLGELALLVDEPTQVNLVAYSDVRALHFPRSAYLRCLDQDPSYFGHFARLGLDRYGVLLRRLAENLGLSPQRRLRARLADFADEKLHDRNDGDPLELHISQSDIAALTGLSRQTTNEFLQRLAKEGLIEVSFRRIRILDPDALRFGDPEPARTD